MMNSSLLALSFVSDERGFHNKAMRFIQSLPRDEGLASEFADKQSIEE